MERLASQLRTDTALYRDNHTRMTALVAELHERLGAARLGGGEKPLQRHRNLGKLPVRERIERLLDAGSPFLELSPLAGWGLYDGDAPGAGLVTGVRRVSGREVLIERQGDAVILRPRPLGWDDFFARPSGVPADFLADRQDPAPEEREPF